MSRFTKSQFPTVPYNTTIFNPKTARVEFKQYWYIDLSAWYQNYEQARKHCKCVVCSKPRTIGNYSKIVSTELMETDYCYMYVCSTQCRELVELNPLAYESPN